MTYLFEIILLTLILALLFFLVFKIGLNSGRRKEARDWKNNKLESIVKERIKLSRAVLGGQFSEQLSPFLPGFNYSPNECRFIGKPIDFIVFRGMDEGRVDEIILVEVKSGRNRNLSKIERSLRDAVKEGRVTWQKYDVPEQVTM